MISLFGMPLPDFLGWAAIAFGVSRLIVQLVKLYVKDKKTGQLKYKRDLSSVYYAILIAQLACLLYNNCASASGGNPVQTVHLSIQIVGATSIFLTALMRDTKW